MKILLALMLLLGAHAVYGETVRLNGVTYVTGGSVTLAISVSDPALPDGTPGAGLKSMQFKDSLSDTWGEETPFSQSYVMTVDIPDGYNGQLIITGRFTDNVRNSSEISTEPFYVDSSAPAGAISVKVDVVLNVSVAK